MIPVARRLSAMNHNVIVAAGDAHLALFKAEIPGLKYIKFKGFSPGYSKYFPQYLAMLFKTPVLLYYIISDHLLLKKLVAEYNIDIVISDNRFGLWNRKVKCVYVTHMPRIPLPSSLKMLEIIGVLLHRFIIKKYALCLIPDLPGELNLSGRLSHGLRLPSNVMYSGIMSRFFEEDSPGDLHFSYPHKTVILSGPEPQRSILQMKLAEYFRYRKPVTVILEGKPQAGDQPEKKDNLVFYGHLSTPLFGELVKSSSLVISRSGYTTIMDLVFLESTALLIPTPGQTEQEYLAEYLTGKGWFSMLKQKDLGLIKGITPGSAIPKMIKTESAALFENALNELLKEDE